MKRVDALGATRSVRASDVSASRRQGQAIAEGAVEVASAGGAVDGAQAHHAVRADEAPALPGALHAHLQHMSMPEPTGSPRARKTR